MLLLLLVPAHPKEVAERLSFHQNLSDDILAAGKARRGGALISPGSPLWESCENVQLSTTVSS